MHFRLVWVISQDSVSKQSENKKRKGKGGRLRGAALLSSAAYGLSTHATKLYHWTPVATMVTSTRTVSMKR
jgi:hypothetical protein